MTRVEVDLLTNQGNGAVLRLPERQFPGVLVQGDTLNAFICLLGVAAKALGRRDFTETEEVIRGFMGDLEELRARYEDALKKHGIGLPY